MFKGNTSEQKAKIIHSLRGKFKLKDILAVTKFPKSTYMYWQKRFGRINPDEDIESIILELRKEHKDFGYRRICAVLRKRGLIINKKESAENYSEVRNSSNIIHP